MKRLVHLVRAANLSLLQMNLLEKNLLGGHPLRAADGQDNGVRVLDLNNDGYMDVVIGNENVRQTRLWSPDTPRSR